MNYSVHHQGQWWDLVVGQGTLSPLKPVWLVRSEGGKNQKKLLCQIQSDPIFGWSVIVAGEVRGVRLVEGFKRRWQAIKYAVSARSDINMAKADG